MDTFNVYTKSERGGGGGQGSSPSLQDTRVIVVAVLHAIIINYNIHVLANGGPPRIRRVVCFAL